MSFIDSEVAAAMDSCAMSVCEFLTDLHHRGQLRPLLEQSLVERYVALQATRLGLATSNEELQAAIDADRRRRGLHLAQQTKKWLTEQALSVDDYEAIFERQILIQKLRTRCTDAQVAERFAARPSDYARAELRHIVVQHEGLASELLSQIRDEGADFNELAEAHSIVTLPQAGSPNTVFRASLPAAMGDAVFAAAEGATLGPFGEPKGFCLIHVVKLFPPCLDGSAAAAIREQMFRHWLADIMSDVTISFPLLANLQDSP